MRAASISCLPTPAAGCVESLPARALTAPNDAEHHGHRRDLADRRRVRHRARGQARGDRRGGARQRRHRVGARRVRALCPLRRDGRQRARAILGKQGVLSDRASLQAQLPAGAARNALDCALWDYEAKRNGTSAALLAGLAPLRPLLTAYTISLDSAEAMAARRRRGRTLHAAAETQAGRPGRRRAHAQHQDGLPTRAPDRRCQRSPGRRPCCRS